MSEQNNELRVLIVDDEKEVALLHARLVRLQEGFRVTSIAHSGRAALQAIEHLGPHVVLLDFGLPDIDGREVLRRLRASNRTRVEVIALTAANDLESVRYARSAGVRHYLVKPFAISALRDRLERVLSERDLFQRSTTEELEQEVVDEIMQGTDSLSAIPPLPKGLGAGTLERVRTALHAAQCDLSASELARALGMSRVTARRYLEFLLEVDEVVVEQRYGSGRPENRFRLRATPTS